MHSNPDQSPEKMGPQHKESHTQNVSHQEPFKNSSFNGLPRISTIVSRVWVQGPSDTSHICSLPPLTPPCIICHNGGLCVSLTRRTQSLK